MKSDQTLYGRYEWENFNYKMVKSVTENFMTPKFDFSTLEWI